MSKIAFVYPGQGVQTVGMAQDFYENSVLSKEVFDKADQVLDFDIKKICFQENQEINDTEYTQAALVTTYLAITKEVENRGIKPDVTAGLSLGEYAAIAVSGGFSYEDAIKTVRQRGILMNRAVPKGEGTMAAILGMTAEQIDNIVNKMENVSVANYNCPGQIVITGKKDAVEKAMESLKEAGKKLGEQLEKVQFTPLTIPYVTNVTAQYVEDVNKTKELLIKQVYSPVRWEESVKNMIEKGVDTFIEIGPGKTIAGFLRKIDRNVKCINISQYEDLKKLNQN